MVGRKVSDVMREQVSGWSMAAACKRMIAARKAAGLTQEQLAARLKVSGTTIYAWERSRVTPTYEQVIAYAEAIGTPADKLLTGEQS